MPEASREEWLALARLPVENARGHGPWRRAWVPWLGREHLSYEQIGCPVQLLTHLSEDQTKVYLMHDESIYFLEAHGPVQIQQDGSAWIEVIGSANPWLQRIHTIRLPADALQGIHAVAREWPRS